MSRRPLRALGAATAAALALSFTACGNDDDDAPAGTSAGTGAATKTPDTSGGKQGGVLKQLGGSDVDSMDPGATYFNAGYQVHYAIGRPLFYYKPGEKAAVPDLADGPAEVSQDGRTVTVKIRKGVKFAPPVDREVTAADVKYAFERAFSANVGNQYSFYFSAIEGAPKESPKAPGSIPGIQVPDPNTLVFKLTEPDGPTVAAALALPITIPVPEEYAGPMDEKSPSTYAKNVVSSGPYMVVNDAKGRATGYKAGKSIELIRNPNWDKSTDFKPAYFDRISMTTNEADASIASQQVLNGSKMSFDANPPADVLEQAVTKFEGQFAQINDGGFRYFPLNTTIKPLDDLNVRKAILAAFDRDAARKARGGKFTGDIPTHFIPPGFPGFEEAGGVKGTGEDFLANPRGDMAVAAKYMKAAGYASGKYEGDEELLMVGATVDPVKKQSQVAKAQLEKLGFKVKLRLVPQDAVYTEFCQIPDRKVAVCGGAAWGKDFNDPKTLLEPTFKGANIQLDGVNNNNLAQLDVPEVDAALDKASALTGDERLKAYGEADKLITANAPAVPFLWDRTTIIWSKDVQGVVNEFATSLDFNFSSLK